jgi:hypothetical protein
MIKLKEIIKELNIPDNMRVHMSKTPITLRNVSISQKTDMKPKGLWYGFGNEWIDWVRGNMPDLEGNHVYHVIFPESKNVLKIKSVHEIMEFTKEYVATNNEINSYLPGSSGYAHAYGIKTGTMYMDWEKVSKKYEGIEIYPYLYNARHELMWYYGWDVASGCVWNFSNIELKEL